MITSVVVAHNKLAASLSILPPIFWGVQPRYLVKRLFCFLLDSSESMRYVGGGVLNNPVTRANQSREGGLGIEPGGRDESFAYAP
jgi:hypothetical protein